MSAFSSLPSLNIPQYDGVVALCKPQGPSSAQCLRPFKGQGQKKIGHAGTLDPMATGVLIILLGQATKLSNWLLAEGQKTYSGTIRLGIETDTWDITGKIIEEKALSGVTKPALAEAITEWTTLREQEVPAYSAAKYNGSPLYKLARKGHDSPVKRKSVKILSAEMLEMDLPLVGFRVTCGSGSYIRSLAHSLGVRLGCGAALASLTREYSYPFTLADCVSMADIHAGLKASHIKPIASALPDWPCIHLNPVETDRVRHGMPIRANGSGAYSHAFLCIKDKPIAIAIQHESADGMWWRVARKLEN